MTMNPQQRKILIICGVVIGLMLLFPPFVTHLPNGSQSGEGYAFLLAAPDGSYGFKPTVNAVQLVAQWLAVCLIGGIAYVLADEKFAQRRSPGMPQATAEQPRSPAVSAEASEPANGWKHNVKNVGYAVVALLMSFVVGSIAVGHSVPQAFLTLTKYQLAAAGVVGQGLAVLAISYAAIAAGAWVRKKMTSKELSIGKRLVASFILGVIFAANTPVNGSNANKYGSFNPDNETAATSNKKGFRLVPIEDPDNKP